MQQEPLAPSQEALWLHQQQNPSSTAYNLAVGIQIRGQADPATIRAALQAVVDRHDPLRSIYKEVDGVPQRFVSTTAPLDMGVITLDPPPSGEYWVEDSRVAAAIEAVAQRPYLLERETLRATLITDGAERHLLLMGLHHLSADGWSARQFVVEGVANFQQLTVGGQVLAEPPTHTYGAWAAGERARLAGEEGAMALEHWRGVLADAPTGSRIPARFPAPGSSLSGARIEVALPGPLRDRLRGLAREQDASMFTAVLAGTQAVLARLASQEDVVVAVPHSNRAEEMRETIGLFVGTLPVRARIGTETTFRVLIDQTSVALHSARVNGWLPIDRIVKSSGLTMARPENSLCQVMVNYLGHAVPAITLSDMQFEYLGTYDTGESQYELSLHLEDTPERARGFVEYRTDCYAEGDIRRFWQMLLAHLEAASANPDQALRELPILTRDDQAELRRLEQGAGRDFDLDMPLDAYIGRQAERTPDAVALSDSVARLSYADMWSRAQSLSATLRRRGVERGDVVCVCAERSVRLPIALLAIMRTGAAYCPLDSEQPSARLRHVLEQACPVAIVADPAQLQLVGDLLGDDESIEVVPLDLDDLADPSAPPLESGEGSRARDCSPSDPAYVIFTSGSTGRPKGVLVPHRGVVNRLLWMQEQFSLSPDDTVLQKTPYTFDVSVWELFWPLMTGARLHLADPGGHRDPESLAQAIRAEKVTTVHFVPTMLGAFAQEPSAAACHTVRRVICSGEALPGALMAEALKLFPGATLWNLYGPTEASIDVTCWQCLPQEPGAPVPIGSPISNVVCAVLDDRLNRVPIGTPGELCIGGVQVALGYIGQPELTEERFVECDALPGRLYRTGDLVRWRADGLLDYLGRVDRQVKIRGVRIELGEIEETLRGMADVADAAVIVRSDIAPAEVLVAYVIPAGPPVEEVELRARLAKLLPEYMVPLRAVTLERLPNTPSGKVDHEALPRPASRTAPRSRVLSSEERLLATLWAQVLGIEDPGSIGPAESYFALGGDSMTSIKLRAEARRAGFELSLKDVLSRPVLADMASSLHACEADPVDAVPRLLPGPASLPAGIEDAYPLSAMQAGMIFHSEFSETSSSYQVTFDLELEMPWAPGLFQEAVDELVGRHEILRTSFDLHSFDEPMQLVHCQSALSLHVTDIHALSGEEQQLECDKVFDAEQVRRFDLEEPPALRLSLIRTGNEVAHLFMAFHDSIFDGWSGAVFMTELFTRYLAKLEGGDLPSRRLDTRYREYIALEREALADAEGLEHWLDLCEGAPFARLPRRGQVAGTGRSRDVGHAVPADVVRRLRKVANDRDVPLKATLVCAYLAAVGLMTGERDVLAGLVSGGRPETADGGGMLGQFLNTVPLRARLEGSWASFLSQVHLAELEGLPFRRVPLFELMKRRNGLPPFETAFNLVHFHVYNELAGQSKVRLLSGRFTDPFHFPLTVNARLHPLDGSLAIVVNYNESEVEAEQARRLAGDVVDALAAIASEPDAKCEDWLGDRAPVPSRAPAPPARAQRIASPGRVDDGGPLDAGITRAMSELWRSVLATDVAEPDQDFFAAGGDSILAVQLAARARSMGLKLRPRDVFECGTLRALIRRVEAPQGALLDRGRQAVEAPVLDPGLLSMTMRRQGGYDCSFICFALQTEFDRDAVLASTEAVFRRHQLLRSVASEEAGRWTRHVLPLEADALPLVWSEPQEVAGWLGELMERVDGAHGPSAVVGYLSAGNAPAHLAFVADHAVADLASLQLAGGDFLDAYAQYAAVGAVALDPAPGLAELSEARLPSYASGPSHRSTPVPWRPRVDALQGRDRVEAIAMGDAGFEGLQRASRAAGVDIQHLLAVALARVLAPGGDQGSVPVVVDLMDMGRTATGVEAELVAPLAHPVPVAVADPGEPALDAARRVAEDLAGSGAGRSRVQELVNLVAEGEPDAEAPGVLVNHLGRVDPDVPWPLRRVVAPDVPLRGAPRRANYAIEVRSRIVADAWSIVLASPRSATSSDQLLAFKDELKTALAAIAWGGLEGAAGAAGRNAGGGMP
jgi:amino acid adenylation domain-containing protein